jgi:hypothetical protein
MNGGVWRIFERARVRFVLFWGWEAPMMLKLEQHMRSRIRSVLRLAAGNGSHIRLCSGEVQVSAPILFLEYVFYCWILIIQVLFSKESFEGLGVGWQSRFSSVEYRCLSDGSYVMK